MKIGDCKTEFHGYARDIRNEDHYKWFVDRLSRSDFTNIPAGGKSIKLPDGLSQYMVTLGLAKVFNFGTEWYEKENI